MLLNPYSLQTATLIWFGVVTCAPYDEIFAIRREFHGRTSGRCRAVEANLLRALKENDNSRGVVLHPAFAGRNEHGKNNASNGVEEAYGCGKHKCGSYVPGNDAPSGKSERELRICQIGATTSSEQHTRMRRETIR